MFKFQPHACVPGAHRDNINRNFNLHTKKGQAERFPRQENIQYSVYSGSTSRFTIRRADGVIVHDKRLLKTIELYEHTHKCHTPQLSKVACASQQREKEKTIRGNSTFPHQGPVLTCDLSPG